MNIFHLLPSTIAFRLSFNTLTQFSSQVNWLCRKDGTMQSAFSSDKVLNSNLLTSSICPCSSYKHRVTSSTDSIVLD